MATNSVLFENLIDIKELSERLKVSVSFLNKAKKKKGLPWHPMGRSVRYRLSEVEAWLQRRAM